MDHMNDSSDAAQHGELPVACTLGSDDASARLQRWQQLHQTAAPSAELTNGEGPLPARSRVAERAAGPGRRRTVCCSFVSWTVTEDGGQPVLCVTVSPSSPDAIESIAAMFAATESS